MKSHKTINSFGYEGYLLSKAIRAKKEDLTKSVIMYCTNCKHTYRSNLEHKCITLK